MISIENGLQQIKTNKRLQRLLALIGVVVILAIVLVMMIVRGQTGAVADDEIVVPAQAETIAEKVQRRIDGVHVEVGKENILPTSVVIENAAFGGVRPQSGLQDANVVYETVAEGGITRLLALYANDLLTERIGPVRSARPYFVDIAEEYRAVFAHAGGSPQGLSRLYGNQYVVDLNQISGDGRYFKRDYSFSSIQEHALFTTKELLAYALRDKGLVDATGSYDGWKFASEDAAKKDRPTEEKKITINFSSASYQAEYLYDREKNYYLRSTGGEAQDDRNTNEQLHVRTVIVQFVDLSILDSYGRVDLKLIGEGKAVVFHDGIAIEGTWKKGARAERTRFYGNDGNEIELIPGNIWVEVVPDDRTVEY